MNKLTSITIGQYLPGDSVVHRLDPRTKLGVSFAFIIMLFLVQSFAAYFWLAALVLLLAKVAEIPLRMLLKGLRPLTFIIVLTLILHILPPEAARLFGSGNSASR